MELNRKIGHNFYKKPTVGGRWFKQVYKPSEGGWCQELGRKAKKGEIVPVWEEMTKEEMDKLGLF